MPPRTSFEGAWGFEVNGGNFGKVRGNVQTINANDVRSCSRVLKHLAAENRDRQRLSESDPRPRRASSVRSPIYPFASATTTRSSASGDSSDSESSDFEDFGTDSMHSDYSTSLSSLDDLHQPPANSLGLDGVPPPQSQFQSLRPPHGVPDIRSPQFPRVQPRRAESRASPLPAYSARVRNPLQNPQNTTPVPPRSANMESHRYRSSYPQPPTSAHMTPRAHRPPPFSRPNDIIDVSPHRINHVTPRLHNLPPAVPPRSTTITPVLVPAPQHQPVPPSQSASSRIHSRPLPHIPGTSSAFPPPTRAPSTNVTPSRVQPQASFSSPNAMRDVRIHGEYNLHPITGGDVRVNSMLTSHTQTPIFNYGYHDYRGCPSPYLYPYGQYTASMLPFTPLYSQYNHPHMAQADDIPWSHGVPQPQWPQQNQHGYQHVEPIPYTTRSLGAGGSSDGTPIRRGL